MAYLNKTVYTIEVTKTNKKRDAVEVYTQTDDYDRTSEYHNVDDVSIAIKELFKDPLILDAQVIEHKRSFCFRKNNTKPAETTTRISYDIEVQDWEKKDEWNVRRYNLDTLKEAYDYIAEYSGRPYCDTYRIVKREVTIKSEWI